MDKKPGGRFGILLAAVGMGLCCAVPVLLVTGGLGVAAAWLFDEGLIWLIAAALALVAAGVLFLYRRSVDRAGRADEHFTGE